MTEPFLMRMAHGAPMGSNKSRWLNNKRKGQHGISSGTVNSEDQTLRVCRRFYVALILSLLVQVLFSSIWTQISLLLIFVNEYCFKEKNIVRKKTEG